MGRFRAAGRGSTRGLTRRMVPDAMVGRYAAATRLLDFGARP
ncbi:hypothetical protein [Streptomyces sp. NBC_01198]|nr:hypothetical protein OG702_29495 [Streptomyces sp. NBC_01198]